MSPNGKIIESGFNSEVPVPKVPYGEILYQNLREQPWEKTILINGSTGEKYSCFELLKYTCSLAKALRYYGVSPNNVIAVSSQNSAEYFYPVFASLYIGATVAPINSDYTSTELKHILEVSQPKIIFCSLVLKEKYESLKKSLDFIKEIVVLNMETNVDYENVQSFIGKHLREPLISEINITKVDPDEHIAFIMNSSGTTGLPKGVMLCDKSLNTLHMQFKDPKLHSKNLVSLIIPPFFHVYGLFTALNSMMFQKNTIFIKEFNEKKFLKVIQDYKVARLVLVPPVVILLNKSPLVSDYNISSIKEIISGAAPLKESTVHELKKKINDDVLIIQGYGLTETSCAVLLTDRAEKEFNPNSIGKVVNHMKMAVRDPETGKFLGPNESGELCFKGNLVMKGYYKNPEATKNAFTEDGWFLTGDVGYFDDEENVTVTDRIKELIKFNGYQVAPAELEALLITHPEILDSGVVGLPHEKSGELPIAFVVKTTDSKLTEEDVKKFVERNLSRQKWLRGGVIFIEKIPKSSSGKILRKDLRKLLVN